MLLGDPRQADQRTQTSPSRSSFINHSTLLLERSSAKLLVFTCTRALDRLRTRRRVELTRRRGNHMHDHSRFQCDIDWPHRRLSLSLSLLLTKVTHAQYRKRFRASYNTFSHITFLRYNHMNSRASVFLDSLLSEHIIRYHMCPWGRLLPGDHTRFFLKRGCCCQGKEVVPVDHVRGKGLSSHLTSGSKTRLTAGFEPCPKDPHLTVLAAAHSPF